MKKIIKKRLEGKTTELIKLADDYKGIILVRDKNCERIAMDMAKKMNCSVVVKTYEDYICNRIDMVYLLQKGIFIDDADEFLKILCSKNKTKLNGISITSEPDNNCDCGGSCKNCMCKERLF